MHLIEQYALSCGVKIDKPHIEPLFFPVSHDKYVTLHASSGMAAKNYDYFPDVVSLILPYLEKHNIKIMQIGGREDPSLSGCIHYHGTTSIRQTAYLIQNSLLHFGNDSFSTHVASGFDKKIVCLYSVLYKECCGPYWGNKDNQILIESDRNGLKPSFSDKESPKMVNLINPETIACSVLDLLNIDHDLHKIKTLHTGKRLSPLPLFLLFQIILCLNHLHLANQLIFGVTSVLTKLTLQDGHMTENAISS